MIDCLVDGERMRVKLQDEDRLCFFQIFKSDNSLMAGPPAVSEINILEVEQIRITGRRHILLTLTNGRRIEIVLTSAKPDQDRRWLKRALVGGRYYFRADGQLRQMCNFVLRQLSTICCHCEVLPCAQVKQYRCGRMKRSKLSKKKQQSVN